MRWTVVLSGVALSSVVLVAATGCQAGDPRTTRSGGSSRIDGSTSAAGSVTGSATRSATGSAGGKSTTQDRPVDERDLRGSTRWRMTRFAEDGQIEGYTTKVSGPPGTRLGFKVSTSQRRFKVFAYRIGSYRGGTGRLVWESRYVKGERQAEAVFAPYETRTVVAPWRRSLSVDTSGWTPGFYVFRLRTASGWENQIPYVVSSPSAENTVALVVPVTTWQAYNLWGGYSLYDGSGGDQNAWAVSFDRPYLGVGGANDFRSAIVPIVSRAEQTGVALSYFANVDLHGDDAVPAGVLAGARGYVSMGHDEYWTVSMRGHVLTARDAGTNLAFLGANTSYWRVRLEDRITGPLRLMTGYRHDAHLDPVRDTRPKHATSRFRDEPAAMPENSLTGMLYECYPVEADYVVMTPGWWGFKGTQVRRGSVIPGLVGGESDRVYPNAATPRPMQILSHASYSCRGTTTSTQSVYYTTPSGAGVFNAATLRWGCALVDRCGRPLGARTRNFAGRVTDNLLRGFAAGPVGRRHPARDNVTDFDLPLVNGVEAS